MEKKTQNKKGKNRRQTKTDWSISAESVSLIFVALSIASKEELLERAIKLGLRGPDLIKTFLGMFLEAHGANVEELMSGEPAVPASQAEVREFVEPFIKRGVGAAIFARFADIYLFGGDLTPDDVLYAAYILIRFAAVQERKPTTAESKQIWDVAIAIAISSKIVTPYWQELEAQGPHAITDWLDEVKETARKRYETFLKRKKLLDASAENTLKSLLSKFFDESEENS